MLDARIHEAIVHEAINGTTAAKPPRKRTRKVQLPDLVYYPETDGEPMADSDYQYDAMVDGKFALVNYYAHDPTVYVAANMFVYHVKGDPSKNIAPDIFVVHDVDNRKRSSYKVWQEGRLPSIVFEVASPGTFAKDLLKKSRYLALRIPEYIMLDPTNGEFFGEAIQGFRLAQDKQGEYEYVAISKLTHEDASLLAGLYSEQLGLEIWAKRGPINDAPAIFRFRNPKTGEWLLSQREGELDRLNAHQHAEQQTRQAEQERQARLAAEAEVARLRELLEKMNNQTGNPE